jgi:hypothetical protein
MSEEEIYEYFRLLCKLKKDCLSNDWIKFELHHIIPRQHRNHPLIVAALKCIDSKFYFNGKNDNLILLEKYINGKGVHAYHPAYNDKILEILNSIVNNFRVENNRFPNACESRTLVIDLIAKIKKIIDLHNDEKVNDLPKYIK